MKKFLLLAAVALSAVTANAQRLADQQMVNMKKVQIIEQQARMSKQAATTQKRLAADDCFYARPEGSMVYGFSKEGSGFYNAYMAVTPYVDFALRNMCSNPADATWTWGGEDASDLADEDNNFVTGCYGGKGYYCPSIVKGEVEYNWGTTDNRYGTNYKSAFRSFDEVSPLRATDPHIGQDLVGWGYLSTHFLFGDGQIDDKNEDGSTKILQCYAIEQTFEKPMSPLYVEDIFVTLVNLDKPEFLAEGEELVLDIRDLDGKVLYSLTCGVDDIIPDEGSQMTNYGELRTATAVFTLKEVDPLSGNLAAVPFVIEDEFMVTIKGFEGKGIGFSGHSCTAEEAAVAKKGYNYFYNVEDEEDRTAYTFQNPISVSLTFSSLFDNVEVWEEAYITDEETEEQTKIDHFNVVTISADGETVTNMGLPEADGIQANTACSWFDEEENEVYYLADEDDEMPEWLTFTVNNEGWESEQAFQPTVLISFQAEALPAGVEGRGVKLYINGRGCQSKEAIYILQGNYTLEQLGYEGEDAITTIKANSNNSVVYNVAGQKVNGNAKGLVIRNGQKTIVK